jgi:hydroxymethylbilane synthase
VLSALDHEETARCVRAERALLRDLEGGCSVPVGALAEAGADGLRLRGCVVSLDGTRLIQAAAAGRDPDALGREVAQRLREQGAEEVLHG